MHNEVDFGIYFSFHQEKDAERAELVMSHSNSSDMDVPSIWTQDTWDEAVSQGPHEADQMIAGALEGIKTTCLLIGERTVDKPWIRPVLKMSHKMGLGIFAVFIHTIPDYEGQLSKRGPNPMGNLKYLGIRGATYPFTSYYFSYDWKLHNGPERFNYWVEAANNQVADTGWKHPNP